MNPRRSYGIGFPIRIVWYNCPTCGRRHSMYTDAIVPIPPRFCLACHHTRGRRWGSHTLHRQATRRHR